MSLPKRHIRYDRGRVRSGADTLQAVMDATGAGKGCGKCRDFLEHLIREIQEEMEKEANHAVRSIGI